MKDTRPLQFAGSWYPADAGDLEALFAAFPRQPDPDLVGGAVPHAGLSYSRKGQSALFSRLPENQSNIILLSPSHYRAISGSSFVAGLYGGYETGIRRVRAADDGKQFEALGIAVDRGAADAEHAVELTLPGLAAVLHDFSLCALLTPQLEGHGQIEALADQLIDLAGRLFHGEKWFLLASSDFTHYGPRFSHQPFGPLSDDSARLEIQKRDLYVAAALCEGRWESALETMSQAGAPTICGIVPLAVQSAVASRLGWKGEILSYYSSSQMRGSYDGSADSVAYGTLGYWSEGGGG